jgi:hypothetical protein
LKVFFSFQFFSFLRGAGAPTDAPKGEGSDASERLVILKPHLGRKAA